MINNKQKELIENLYDLLLDINNEAINDDNFNNWLNKNQIFEVNLEEYITKLKKIK